MNPSDQVARHERAPVLYLDRGHVFIAYDMKGNALAINIRNGRWINTTASPGHVLYLTGQGFSFAEAVSQVAEQTPWPDELRVQAQRLIDLGVLTTRPCARQVGGRPKAGTPAAGRVGCRPDRDIAQSCRYRLLAAICFWVAAALLIKWPALGRARRGRERSTIMPFRFRVALMAWICEVRRQRPATVQSVAHGLATVRAVARSQPWRADCWKITIATFILEAIRGQAPTWCVGGIPGWDIRHAWFECDQTGVHHGPQLFERPAAGGTDRDQPEGRWPRSLTAESAGVGKNRVNQRQTRAGQARIPANLAPANRQPVPGRRRVAELRELFGLR